MPDLIKVEVFSIRNQSLPITSINGELRFYGGIANKQIFNAIRKR